MTAYTFDSKIVTDLHKDAYGTRGGELFRNQWNEADDDGKQKIWDSLLDALERSIQEEKEQDELAVTLFNAKVKNIITCGAGNRETAIRWIVQGMGLSETDLMYGGDYVCYNLGLPYSMRHEFDPICKELLKTMETVE